MAALSDAFAQMLILLLITMAGYVATRLGNLDGHTRDKMTQVLVNFALPSMIIASAHGLDVNEVGPQIPWTFGLGVALFFISLLLGWVYVTVFRVSPKQRRDYLFISTCSNLAFVGIPVISAIIGPDTVLLCSVFIMVFNIFYFSIGMAIIAPEGQRAFTWKSIVNMPLISCLIALGLLFSGWELPFVLQRTVEMIGAMTAPLAMMLIGVVMVGIRVRHVLHEWRLFPYFTLRGLLVPLLLFWIGTRLNFEPTVLGVFVMMFAMPVGSMGPAFMVANRRDPRVVAEATILSTVLAFILVPLLVWGMTLIA